MDEGPLVILMQVIVSCVTAAMQQAGRACTDFASILLLCREMTTTFIIVIIAPRSIIVSESGRAHRAESGEIPGKGCDVCIW